MFTSGRAKPRETTQPRVCAYEDGAHTNALYIKAVDKWVLGGAQAPLRIGIYSLKRVLIIYIGSCICT